MPGLWAGLWFGCLPGMWVGLVSVLYFVCWLYGLLPPYGFLGEVLSVFFCSLGPWAPVFFGCGVFCLLEIILTYPKKKIGEPKVYLKTVAQ